MIPNTPNACIFLCFYIFIIDKMFLKSIFLFTKLKHGLCMKTFNMSYLLYLISINK